MRSRWSSEGSWYERWHRWSFWVLGRSMDCFYVDDGSFLIDRWCIWLAMCGIFQHTMNDGLWMLQLAMVDVSDPLLWVLRWHDNGR